MRWVRRVQIVELVVDWSARLFMVKEFLKCIIAMGCKAFD
jgi:hypothetical protein